MGGIIQVDTIQNNNTSTIITQTNTTTITIARSGQTIVIPSGTTFNASSASVNLPSINLATGVTGTLPVANGGTGLTALGTANQVLAVNSGATALTFTSVSSDYVLLATTTVSSAVGSVSFDGYFSSTYTNYKLVINGLLPATNAVNFFGRFRRSNADVTASSYWGAGWYTYQYSADNNSSVFGAYNAAQLQLAGRGSFANTSGKTSNWSIDIYEPLNTSNYKNIFFTQTGYWETSNNLYSTWWGGSVLYDSTAALSGITFYFSSGNISSGTFKLYGIK